MAKIKLPTIYSQWDNKWSKEILGYNTSSSGFDIYNFGCLITCIAMVLEYYGKSEDPKDLNEDLKDGSGFSKDSGNYIWGSVKRLFKQIKDEKHIITPYALSDSQIEEINTALDYGYPVMFQIDYNPATVKPDMHFVLAIGRNPADENDYTIVDPLGGVEKSLKKYLGWFKPNARKTIENYTIFQGDVPVVQELKDTLIDFDDMEGKRRTVLWYVKAWFDQKTDKANQKKEFEQALIAKDLLFSQNATMLTESTRELARKESKIQELNQSLDKLKQENARLIDQNSSLYEIVDLIRMALAKINILPKK